MTSKQAPISELEFRYETKKVGEFDIHLRTLKDTQQFSDDAGEAEDLGISSSLWPLFGVVWQSGQVLAHYMYDFDINGKRILELGCGIALASLVLNRRGADITATDYHPEAENFLVENTRINTGKKIPFYLQDWKNLDTDLGKFDVIIGSDLLYERGQVGLLANFIDLHANESCEVIIVDAGRGYKGKFCKEMAELSYDSERLAPQELSYLDKSFNGAILLFNRSTPAVGS